MANASFETQIVKLIEQAVRDTIDKKIQEITEEAKKSLESGIKESMAGIALSVLKHYSVESNRGEVIIRVHNDVKIKE